MKIPESLGKESILITFLLLCLNTITKVANGKKDLFYLWFQKDENPSCQWEISNKEGYIAPGVEAEWGLTFWSKSGKQRMN